MYDIIIIGAGPAGLTAALYALRANKNILIFEAKTYGGQILNASKIENYPGIENISGFDFATNLYKQVTNLGAVIKYETVLRVDENKNVTTNKDTYSAKSVIIATGSENRRLNIENESKYVGKGISYCATCDGNFFKNKTVAVVGGGDTALEDAIYLSDIASKVYLIHRREEFTASEALLSKLDEHSNIEIIKNSTISKLIGEEILSSVEIVCGDTTKVIDIDGLFIAVGQEPKNQIFSNILELDSLGYIKTIDGVRTNIKGIYVAGDTRVKELRQLTTAVSDGSIAATIAIREMNEK
ncbi:MAG: thioredoxin-disulfide reductase [Bacilli bacterium]|nr:thioredoxin-disulfide reductase [Bacilli bacterium]